MPTTKQTAELELREFSALLGLPYEPQDWGIINAAGDRLDEFVKCFQRLELSSTVRYELADLILASANDLLLNGGTFCIDTILGLYRGEPVAFSNHIRYWASLDSPDEFPIAPLLRDALKRGG